MIEIKEMAIDLVSVLSIKNAKPFSNELLKALLPMIMNGTRENDAMIRFRGEVALVNLLRLKENDSLYKVCFDFLIFSY